MWTRRSLLTCEDKTRRDMLDAGRPPHNPEGRFKSCPLPSVMSQDIGMTPRTFVRCGVVLVSGLVAVRASPAGHDRAGLAGNGIRGGPEAQASAT